MGSKKTKLIALVAILVIGVAVGVAVIPTPKPAWALHPNLSVDLGVDWIDVDPYGINAEVSLLDLNGDVIVGFTGITLYPNTSYTHWSRSLTNVPDNAVQYRITWNTLAFNWHNLSEPIQDWIDWNNPAITPWTHCED